MSLIKNLSIKSKLSLLFFVLLLPLGYFLAISLETQLKERSSLQDSNQKLTESDLLTDILHETQAERAYVLASKDKEYRQRLLVQRKATDISFNAYFSTVNDNPTLTTLYSELKNKRRESDEDSTISGMSGFYRNKNEVLLSEVRKNLSQVEDPAIKELLNTHYLILMAKRDLGIIRTQLNACLVSHTFSTKEYVQFATTKNNFDNQLNAFLAQAPLPVTIEYQNKILGNKKLTASLLQLSVISESQRLDLSQNPYQWFDGMTDLINNFKVVEDFAIDYIHAEMDRKVDYKQKLALTYVVVVIFTLVIAVSLSIYIISNVSGALVSMKSAADQVAMGNTNVTIDYVSKDEIGSLADSLRTLIQKNKALANAAVLIGKERYDTQIVSSGKEDELSNSLIGMRDSLEKLSEADKKRNWMLTGNNELNDIVRGEKDLQVICEKICRHLCTHLEAIAGAAYLLEDNRLHLLGAFHYPIQETVIIEGDGVIGQVSVDKKMVVLNQIPNEQLKIETTMASVATNEVLLLPLVYNNETAGVIELLKKDTFNESAKEYLESIAEKLAIVINNVKAEIRTNELLGETQTQAEELEAQQEELRQINDELRVQRDQLQASEEELRVSEEELMQKNGELEEKTNELEEQYEELKTKNLEIEQAREAVQLKMNEVETVSKYKSDFLANMSHELRTPLNSILILANILKTNANKTLNQKETEHASIIEKSGNDLLRLINEILDLARIESGKVKLEPHDYSFNEFNLESQFEGIIHEKKIEYTVSLDKDLPFTIYTDKFRVEQILKNLLSNAFKFTPNNGKIEFSIYKPNSRVVFKNASLKKEETIAFSVKDSGIGIPDDKKHLVFEAFQQADPSTTRKYGGTGLGLTISRDLAALLGGEIQFESKVSEGSTFILYLPVQYTSTEQTSNESKEELPKPAHVPTVSPTTTSTKNAPKTEEKISILIIEDDFYFCGILSDYAEKKGYTVFKAYNAESGLELARNERPSAILLDVKLPDLDGWEVLKQIKSEPGLKKIPVHMMSAYDKEGVQDLGQEDFISKPVTLDMLENALGKIKFHEHKTVKKVLIIEDNENENQAVKELLSTQEMYADSALSGAEGLKLLKENKYECLILDIKLPDMTGYQVLEALNKDPELSTLPVIIYSGMELTEEEVAAYKKYANTIIIKTEYSYTRLLEEVKLFLFNMDQNFKKIESFHKKIQKAEVALDNKKVLIADDDMRNIYSLSNILESYNMQVITAYDGRQALEQLEAHPDTQLVLMDIMMPQMDGIEATKAIRAMPKFRNLPIIAVTAKAMPGDKEQCLKAGVSDYLSKPIDVNKLVSLLRVWLYEN